MDQCIRYSDLLRARRSGGRIPVVARFSAPLQTDRGAHLTPVQRVPRISPGSKMTEVWR